MSTLIFLTELIILINTQFAHASVPAMYGLGSRASAMASAYTAIADDPFGWYYNPAGPATSKQFDLRIGVTSAIENLKSFKDVVVKNDATRGDVPADYKNTLGTVIGATIPLWKNRVSVGTSIFLPTGILSRIHSTDPYLPNYTFFDDRTQRPNIILGGGWHPLDWVSIGGGVISATTIGGTIYSDIAGQGAGETIMEVKTTLTPIIGIKNFVGPFEIGATYRGESAGRTKTRVQIDGAPMPIELDSTSVAYFDPQEISLGIGYRLKKILLLQAEATWTNWGRYIPSSSTTKITSPDIPTSDRPKPNFNDTFTIRLGSEIELPTFGHNFKYRLGYAYVPTPVPYQAGKSNFVDNNKHIGSLGLGTDIPGLPVPVTTDIHFQTQYLVPTSIIKSDPSVIGGPGYTSGGLVFNFGLTLGTTF